MKWVLAGHDAAATARLSDQAGIHPLIARLMVVRGITGIEEARKFLNCDLSSLTGPEVLRGMERAVRRIRDALASGEGIVVYGDYDVDGVTGSAVLWLALREMGARVESYIPDRMSEGYGLNEAAIRKIADASARLIITVDCGVTAANEAKVARELGIDLIITDHHEFGDVRPDCYEILHPALPAEDLPGEQRDRIEGLTGAGVAFKLVQGLWGADATDERVYRYLDLVTLGTVADMGRITGENRVLVRHGLEQMSSTKEMMRPGIESLKQVAGLSGRRVTVGTVGFTLAPRINASGRLSSAQNAFQLLTTDDPQEAIALAAKLDAVNRERQAVEERIWLDARERCLAMDPGETGAFVLASEDWHPGVVGIVASRIVDEFYRPAALISLKDGIGRGSARSIPGFDLYEGLSRCADLLQGFGGHQCAAGITLAADKIPLLRERLSSLVLDRFGSAGFVRTITIDAPVTFDDLTLELLRDIERIAPFGQGNPEPRLGAKRLEVTSLRPVGNKKHAKLRLRQENGRFLDAIAYNKWESLGERLRPGDRVAVVFVPRLNSWNGNTTIELEIKDVKFER